MQALVRHSRTLLSSRSTSVSKSLSLQASKSLFSTSKYTANNTSGVAFDVTDENWKQLVVEASHKNPVVLDCWAGWCGPCRTLGPILEKSVEDKGQGVVKMAKLDVDSNPVTAEHLNLTAIPAVFAFSRGQVIDTMIGLHPREKIENFVEKLLQSHQDNVNKQ
jgi:thioredoxin